MAWCVQQPVRSGSASAAAGTVVSAGKAVRSAHMGPSGAALRLVADPGMSACRERGTAAEGRGKNRGDRRPAAVVS